MAARATIVVCSLLVLVSACTSEQANPSADLSKASQAWAECRGVVMMQGVKSSLSPEALTDQAFAACEKLEDQFLAAGIAANGQTWTASFSTIRGEFRKAMTERIIEIRSGKSPSNPQIAWGRCTGERANAERSSSGTTDEKVERIMRSCRQFESAVRTDAIAKLGEREGQLAVDELLPQLKAMLKQRIETTKAN